MPFAVTAPDYAAVPEALTSLVGTVVAVPPLRERLDDVVPLALQAARRARGRELALTRAAEAALRSCGWPGNVAQLEQVVRQAATRTDVIDVRHLPADVLSGTTPPAVPDRDVRARRDRAGATQPGDLHARGRR